jgi:glycosyltransferase involved in cell wall biosynthesis
MTRLEDGSRPDLFVFAPVYNEEGSIRLVVQEWIEAVRRLGIAATFLILDDGSTDGTPSALKQLGGEFPELRVLRNANRGHGPTCTHGYRLALDSDAEWIFQIDSDGQCNPSYFPTVWAARTTSEAVFGYRTRRDDGFSRLVVSRVLSSLLFLLTGIWIRDSNVPYRLIHRPLLQRVLGHIPEDAGFPNVLLSIAIARDSPQKWVPIRFRDRSAGTSMVNLGKMGHFARQVYTEVRRFNRSSTAPAS